MAKESLLPQRQSSMSNTSTLGSNRGGNASYSRYIRSNPNGATSTSNRTGGTSDLGSSNAGSGATGVTGFNPYSSMGSFYSMPSYQYTAPSRMMGFQDYLQQYMGSMGGLSPFTRREESKPETPAAPPTPRMFSGNEALGQINSRLKSGLNADEITQAKNFLGQRDSYENISDQDISRIVEEINRRDPSRLVGGI